MSLCLQPSPCAQLSPLSLLWNPSPAWQDQLSQGWVLREMCRNAPRHSDLSKDTDTGSGHLPASSSSWPCCWSLWPHSLVTKPHLLFPGRSLPSNTEPRPHPCSAPSCWPEHTPQLHGCFSLCLYSVSGLSFSLDSSFSPSMLSFRRKVDVRCVLHILTVIINDLNDQSLSAAHLRAGWVEQGWEEMVSRWFCVGCICPF